ncbi:7229_t:CDS:2, partial [Cetraspora pellucida]
FEAPNVQYYKGKEKLNENTQEESSSRAKRLKLQLTMLKSSLKALCIEPWVFLYPRMKGSREEMNEEPKDETNSNTENVPIFRSYIYRNEINQFDLINPMPSLQHDSSTVPMIVYPSWRPSPSLEL